VGGPGGHSWSDAGEANPIFILSRVLTAIETIELPESPRTTLSAGQIAGGTSVNSIPELASVLLDLRSTDSAQLLASEAELRHVVEAFSGELTASAPTAKLSIETIGDRPAGQLAEDSSLLHAIRAVDRHLALRTELRLGSTDANLPLSLGIPAVALGAGGTGGGIHTLQEWYDPTGREIAMRRVLLILLATVQQVSTVE
jgi:di/tripeptidase